MGIPLTTFDAVQEIDVTIDGADEVDPQFRLIKGGGGALLHEKVVASASRRLVIVADSTKRVPMLGNFPLPIEVIAFAELLVKKKIEALGASVKLRLLKRQTVCYGRRPSHFRLQARPDSGRRSTRSRA